MHACQVDLETCSGRVTLYVYLQVRTLSVSPSFVTDTNGFLVGTIISTSQYAYFDVVHRSIRCLSTAATIIDYLRR